MRLTFCLILLFFTNTSLAQNLDAVQADRFQYSLRILKKTLSADKQDEDSLKKIMSNMTRGGNRVASFNIQSLGQIYQKYNVEGAEEFFKDSIRFEAKSLEDAIGTIAKWRDVLKNLKKNNAEQWKIKNAEKSLSLSWDLLRYVLSGQKTLALSSDDIGHEFEKLVTRFEDGKSASKYKTVYWVGPRPTLVYQMEKDLKDYPWLPYSEDRSFVIKRLRKHLENVVETTFNFGLLEDTETEKGLHEFRREIRWFSFQARNLNGTVTYFENIDKQLAHCPIDELKPLLKQPNLSKSPYTRLPKSRDPSEDLCGISKCLMYKMTDVVGKIGSIKDKAEQLNYLQNLKNKTPAKQEKEAEAIYEDLMVSGTLEALQNQLKSCE